MSKKTTEFCKVVKTFLVVLLVIAGMGQAMVAQAATESQREGLKQEILEIYYNVDEKSHNVLNYRITEEEFLELFSEIQYGEGTEIFGAYYPATNISYTTFWGYVKTIQLTDADADVLTRYNKMIAQVETTLSGIEEDMTDLDKLIYLHDSVVELVSYGGTTDAKYIASGALGDKKAVCAGYAKALNVLLRREGFDTTYVKGTSLGHGWSYVKLDGEWYHVDPTWDDTRTPVLGQVSRANLLKNDAEFGEDHGEWLVRRVEEVSDSTLYTDWFVQDIVGEMSFEDGLWYYLDTENQVVMSSDAKGEQQAILFDYSELGTVYIVDAVDDQLILNVDGDKISRTIDEWKQAVEDVAGDDIEDGQDQVEEGSAADGVITDFALDLSDINLWRTGHYNPTTGTYASNKFRICTNDLIKNTQSSYVVKISDDEFRMVIRELNERTKMISSVDLGNGDVYVPGEGTAYLAVSIYNCVQEKGNFFSVYEEMFANGFQVGFGATQEEGDNAETEDNATENESVTEDENITENDGITEDENAAEDDSIAEDENTTEDDGITEDEMLTDTPADSEGEENTTANVVGLDLSDVSLWRTGHYNPTTGTYASNKFRICTNDLIENTQSSYVVKISDENFRMVIRELNEKTKMIASVDLGNGDAYVPGEGTVYLAVSIYNCVQEKGNFFSVYEEMFANGFRVGLEFIQEEQKVQEEEANPETAEGRNEETDQEEAEQPEADAEQSQDETEESAVPSQTFRELLHEMLITGDTSVRDVSAYNVTVSDLDDTWNAMIAEEGYIAFEARAGVITQITKDEYGKILTLWLYDLATGDFQTRYTKLVNCIEEVRAAVDSKMTEFDKVLYVHEYVLEHTAYSTNGYQTSYAGGALGEGYAKCEGYARTCMLLLRQLGMECYRVSSTDMNHAWVYVRVDGEWFHMDPTWDDGTEIGHTYLLRNSQEFDTMEGRHYNWKLVNADQTPESSSTKLNNWFVHNVVGRMYYEAGMWYYIDVDTGSVVRSDIYGNGYEVLVENIADGYVLTGVSHGQVSYYAK